MLTQASVVSQQTPTDYTFRSSTELVLVNVTVRDKNGNPVRDLKREDFTVLEDNKPQQVVSFDLENTDAVLSTATAEAPLLAPSKAKTADVAQAIANRPLKDRRLIILFFDLSSMQPDEIDHAVTAAQNYVDKQMQAADLVSVVSLGDNLAVNQDFTSDRTLLKKALDDFNLGAGGGFEEGSTGTTEGTAETGGSFTVDDTEYNIFNTDRRLQALRSIADKLTHIDEKKSLIYFSSGMDRTGIENQSQLRSATNAAVRANMAIYTIDIRGLQALVPGGEAQNASMRGTSPYSGKAMASAFDSNFTTQETLVTLAGDTGGRAFLDSNDFSKVFTGVQQDTSLYYLLGYHSTNTARDGRFRRITVRLNRPGLKIDFRRGYYAPADFKHANRDERERQLDEELASELADHGFAGVFVGGLFPHRRPEILCAGVAGRARFADSFYPQQRSGPRDPRRAWRCNRHGQTSGGTNPGYGEAGGEHQPTGAAQERAIQQRLRFAAGPVSPEVCGAGEPERTPGIV